MFQSSQGRAMPKVRGVYRDAKGGWYFKAATHKDPTTGKWKQATRRGYATAADAAKARETFFLRRRNPNKQIGEALFGD